MKPLKFSRFQLFVHAAALTPLAWLVIDFLRDDLTANPIQALTLRTGKYALVLLILSLACTPLNTVFGFRPALKVRRALGLYAFLYASLHFLIFVGLDYGFDPVLLQEAIFEKRFALVGFAAFMILVSLAITSTKGWMKRLGKNWKRLHQLVYLAGLLVVVHYIWQVKSDIRVPLVYGAVVVLLLVARLSPVRRTLSRVRQARISRAAQRLLMKLRGGIKEPVIRAQDGINPSLRPRPPFRKTGSSG
jgi:sulfoxide reductase heme-binding subunit YedZ